MPKIQDGKWVMCRKCSSTAVFTPYRLTAFCLYCMAVFDPSPEGTLLVMGPHQRPEEDSNSSA